MPSKSRVAFKLAKRKAARLLVIATEPRLRPLTYADIEPGLHAALAGFVSAWEAYVEHISLEILDEIGRASDARVNVVLGILLEEAKVATERFNTPNFENCRNLILRFTGFDPYNYMAAPRVGFTVQQTQIRLNEILRVRHAFAHGFPIPGYLWLTRYGVQSRLSKGSVTQVITILDDLVKSLDKAAAGHLFSVFGIRLPW